MGKKEQNIADEFTPEKQNDSIQAEAEEKETDTEKIETAIEAKETVREAEGPAREVKAEDADEADVDSGDESRGQEPDEDEKAAGEEVSDEEASDAEAGDAEAEDAELSETHDSPEEKNTASEKEPQRKNGAKNMPENAKRRRKRRRKKEKKPMGKKPFIIAGSIFGALLLIYLGISAYFIGHFYINTTINGKDFSGKSAAAVEEYMKEQVKDYELKIIEQNNESDIIKGSDISLVYKENSDIEKALKGQNPLLWPKAFFSKSSAEVTIEVGYDKDALDKKIQSVKAVTQEQTEPVSAYPKYDGNSFVVEPEVYGTKVDMELLNKKIAEYITEFKSELNMMEEECYAMPQYTSESEEVQKACDEMNGYLKASITYKMDKDVVVDKELISTWLTYNDKMEVSLNEEKVREWMREFGKTYDTVKKTRSITTPTGKTAEVSGGTYGWSVDEKEETKVLIESIKKGEVTEKEPVYEQKAASRSAQDWGNTYLEVDIAAQHMWYIVDGSVALETDVVTGVPNPDRETPTGVYSIIEMKRDKTLIGAPDPETGEPIYETPVSYWMRVTWTGIGFHDATWQSSFGGSRYVDGYGSHGCINMPIDKASELYGMLEMGTPVIIHN